jgi:hypothetical protein
MTPSARYFSLLPIIDRVNEHIHYIRFAEEFNGRIGSKALFK